MAAGLTPSQTVGPYLHLLLREELTRMGVDGMRDGVELSGHVLDGNEEPVPDAMLELWQADVAGRYAVSDPATASPPGFTGFARVAVDADGRYAVRILKPGSVDGQAPHIAVSVFARGLLHRLVTRIYFPDEVRANAADPVLAAISDPARRATLLAAPAADGLRFDLRLQGPAETVFFAV